MELAREIGKAVYEPHQIEAKWLRFWEEKNFFHAEPEPGKPVFSMVIPPPNVTGALHLGHALNNTLQDTLARWRRMQGYNTLWVPGTDHAGIATQARVEEELAQEGISKFDLGREGFLGRVWAWKERYGGEITWQLRVLGVSCDWQRERFTLDRICSRAVREAFVRLYEKGLIYRGNYLVNWCPKCRTTISDIEVEHKEKDGLLYYLFYPLKGEEGGVVVATTRPETMLGDTAVAVHPEDKRYQHLLGKTLVLPLVQREIPVIADSLVDPNFGTGAVKVTPAHDPVDFELAQRHALLQVVVIAPDATMTAAAGKYAGKERYQCREEIVKDLAAGGFLVKTESYRYAVGHCYRCGVAVEPLVSEQWFLKMAPFVAPAREAVLMGKVRFIPERFTKIYLRWLEGLKDWCLSRQLWWGHRIPIWYCRTCGEVICKRETPEVCPVCKGKELEQDPDVLDTWFSSALWPFSTLGWPEETPEFKHFYPTTVLVTGRDIIFFWVARMLFLGLELTGEVPFREVLVHGLVRDEKGRKMSKSLGNGVDPLEVVALYGADALRFMLVTGNTPGNDLRFHGERVEGARNFTNKLWNASRFLLLNLSNYQPRESILELSLADQWILSRLNRVIREATASLEAYELGEAARTLYDFTWGEFCDWYLEFAKEKLYGKETRSRGITQAVLLTVFETLLRLLHPFLPFITEEIWQRLPRAGESIAKASWPEVKEAFDFPEAERKMALIQEVIRRLRNLRKEMQIPAGKEMEAIVVAPEEEVREALTEGKKYICALARLKLLKICASLDEKPKKVAAIITEEAEIFVPLGDLIDFEKEIQRLLKEKEKGKEEQARVKRKLANPEFLKKAPWEVVAKEREKEEGLAAKIKSIEARLQMLSGL